MTGIIAGTFPNIARIAIDSHLSNIDGKVSRGMKLFVLSHLPAVLAGRGNIELFWNIAGEAMQHDASFDELAQLLPDVIIGMTQDMPKLASAPPERRAGELFLVGWSASADRPAIHTYTWRYDQTSIDEHLTSIGQDGQSGLIISPQISGVNRMDLLATDGLIGIMRRQAAEVEAQTGSKSIGGNIIVATVDGPHSATIEVAGSVDDHGRDGEIAAPSQSR